MFFNRDDFLFGGKSILAVGDFYQLKPVSDKPIYEIISEPGAALAPPLWHSFEFFELKTVVKQRDVRFSTALGISNLGHRHSSLVDKA